MSGEEIVDAMIDVLYTLFNLYFFIFEFINKCLNILNICKLNYFTILNKIDKNKSKKYKLKKA